MPRSLIDLSHTISHEMMTHPWMPKPLVSEHISREQSASFLHEGVTFHIAQVSMSGNTGTYLDAPFQFHADGPDVSDVPLDRLVDVPIEVVRVDIDTLPDQRSIGVESFEGHGDLAGKAVLVYTGHSQRWGTGGFFKDSPFLTEEATKFLVAAEPGLVGIDSQNIDSGTDMRKPAQNLLLGADILLLECVGPQLDDVPERGARLTVLPAPIAGMGSIPVRAVAVVDE